MSNSLYHDVCEYDDRGFTVIPMRAGAKKPAVRWGRYQNDRPTKRTLRRWFRDRDDYTGAAVLFGRASGGLGQRDFDEPAIYDSWALEHPDLAATLPTVATSRGRRHVYFGVDPDDLANTRQQLGKPGNGSIKLDYGELRADTGCYSLLPRSLHPSGAIYEWLTPLPPELPIVPLSAFVTTTIDVSPECYTCNVSDALDELCRERVANSESLEKRIDAAIKQTTPTGPGQRNRLVFEFVRRLKAIPELADSGAPKHLIVRWHAAALPFIATKGISETRLDFLVAWDRVKVPAGGGATLAMLRSMAEIDIPLAAMRYEDPKMRLLVSLCRQLQRNAGDRPFPLSCSIAARMLSIPHMMTVWRWLKLLTLDDVLRMVSKGTTGRTRNPKASEYRYRCDL